MGYRTVVMLNNDQAGQWENDPELGKKISHAMNFAGIKMGRQHMGDIGYGRVVECTHASTVTLAVLSDYEGFEAVAHASEGCPSETPEDRLDRVFREFASKLGYRVVRKLPKEGETGNLFS